MRSMSSVRVRDIDYGGKIWGKAEGSETSNTSISASPQFKCFQYLL